MVFQSMWYYYTMFLNKDGDIDLKVLKIGLKEINTNNNEYVQFFFFNYIKSDTECTFFFIKKMYALCLKSITI